MTDYTIWLPNLSDSPGRSFFEFLPPRWGIPEQQVGGAGGDVFAASPAGDWFNGCAGDDVIAGGPGNDLLVGGAGGDVLRGGGDADILVGGRGNDRLDGGGGADVLVGGKGRDKFYVSAGDGDIIADFEPGVDRLFVDGERVTLREARLIGMEIKIIEALEFTLGVGRPDLDRGELAPNLVRLAAHFDDLLV